MLRGLVCGDWRLAAAVALCCAGIMGMAAPATAQYQWQAVVGGGAAVGNGFGDPANQAVGAAIVFNGRLFMAVGGDTGQAFQLWWSDDGTVWNKHPEDGFGDPNNEGVAAMAVYDGFLYAGTTNSSGSGSQVFRTDDGTIWTAVNTNGFGNVNNRSVVCLEVHDDQLFAGTENQNGGGQIWRTSNGTLWLPAMIGGFGLGSNTAVASLQGYGPRLYAGTFRDSTLFNQPGELWWSENYTDWNSASAPGFGDGFNVAMASMAVHEGHLFVGTSQLNYLLGGTGCEVWRWNGAVWQLVGVNGFGSNQSTTAVRFFPYNGELLLGIDHPGGGKIMRFVDILDWDTLVSGGFGNAANQAISAGEVFNANLYVGTFNPTQGCEAYREIATVFVDGFESGDTSAWSSAVP